MAQKAISLSTEVRRVGSSCSGQMEMRGWLKRFCSGDLLLAVRKNFAISSISRVVSRPVDELNWGAKIHGRREPLNEGE